MSEKFPSEPIKTVWTVTYGDPKKTAIYKETDKCVWVEKSWGSGFRRIDKPDMYATRLDALRAKVERAKVDVKLAEAALERSKGWLSKREEEVAQEEQTPTA
jgi:hypothetical protein